MIILQNQIIQNRPTPTPLKTLTDPMRGLTNQNDVTLEWFDQATSIINFAICIKYTAH
ncbi:hypothetical protein DDB_G0270142 [Dictyostelium discoideum AX4]|uniref:Uncharacterized protein n=1 Tax=Dictyostelium discoideum TaxID=44689 RepID=Q55CA8_DICDI|nr:hypothetical protein DDB_G0270142 [Dictyostelium discoideum AX4]EAL72421.1 hypothetical protein DDB_G0270142 [Dictyostelium discoideum AX4]|eukprot:XP_646573.1 hypothetical protein DDB_G0270142 [Dictyostelium discoideum AX4]